MPDTITPQAAPSRPRAAAPGRHRALPIIVSMLAASVLWIVYGLTPFAIRASVIFYIAVGRIDCGVDSLRDAARSTCELVGGPLGGLFATNIPVIQSSVLLSRFVGIPPEWSYSIVSWLVLFAGIYGTYRFLRLFAVRTWVALAGAVAWTGSISVLGVLGFGGMLFGAVLLPSLAFLGLSTVRALRRRRVGATLGWAAGWASLTVALLFSDGYTFIMGSLVVGVLVLASVWGHWRDGTTWLGIALLAAISGLAFVLYRAAIPNAGSWGADSIDKFRAFGLDLSTLVVPSDEIWWADLLGVGIDPNALWGDGSNSAYNYLGALMLVLAGVGVVLHPRGRRRLVVALVVIGAAGLLLSLGPDLKLAEAYDPDLAPAPTSMPPGIASLDLPTGWIFSSIPGIEYMRAIYRWVLLLRLAVVVLAAIGVEALVRRGRRTLAITLGLLAIIEVSYNPVAAVRTNLDKAAQMRAFDHEVVDPMASALEPGDRVVFVSGTEKANDYLAVYLAPRLEVSSWNIGNDKALRRARTAWPSRIDELIARAPEGERLRDLTASVLEDGTVTKVVVLDFDLRDSAKNWPPSPAMQARGDRIAATLEGDDRLLVERHDHFDVVTLAD